MTLIAGLAAPRRLLARRDGNGVAEGAHGLVERALGSSSGSALPGELRRRFEGSLGADLGDVRVHTGGESAQSATAVGAKAYTLGQDIHFAEGHYDPTSEPGQELLAHEVAHTVQHGAVVGRKPSFKLEVSAPGDALEVEADAAAARMVKGLAAPVLSGGVGPPGLARSVDQDVDVMADSLNKAGDTAAALGAEQQLSGPSVLTVTNVDDMQAAQRILDNLAQWTPVLESALGKNDESSYVTGSEKVTEAKVNANVQVESQVRSYVEAAEGQGISLSQFQPLYLELQTDFNRLNGMIKSIDPDSGFALDDSGNDGAGSDAPDADQLVKEELGKADASKDVKTLASAPGTGAQPFLTAANQSKAQLDGQVGTLEANERNTILAVSMASGALHTYRSVLTGLRIEEIQSAIDERNAKAAEASTILGQVSQTMQQFLPAVYAGVKAVTTVDGNIKWDEKDLEQLKKIPEDPTEAISLLIDKVVKPQVMHLLKVGNDATGDFDMSGLEDVKKIEMARQAEDKMKGAKGLWTSFQAQVNNDLDAFAASLKTLHATKQAYMQNMQEAGKALDKASSKNGTKPKAAATAGYAETMTLIAAGENFVTQAKLVTDIGTQQLDTTQAGDADTLSTAKNAHQALGQIGAEGQHIYAPVEQNLGKDGVHVLARDQGAVHIYTGGYLGQGIGEGGVQGSLWKTGTGSAEQGKHNLGANAAIPLALVQTRKMSDLVAAFVAKLRLKILGPGK